MRASSGDGGRPGDAQRGVLPQKAFRPAENEGKVTIRGDKAAEHGVAVADDLFLLLPGPGRQAYGRFDKGVFRSQGAARRTASRDVPQGLRRGLAVQAIQQGKDDAVRLLAGGLLCGILRAGNEADAVLDDEGLECAGVFLHQALEVGAAGAGCLSRLGRGCRNGAGKDAGQEQDAAEGGQGRQMRGHGGASVKNDRPKAGTLQDGRCAFCGLAP